MPQMMKKANSRGSALVFAVVASALLALLVGAALTGALVFYANSERGNRLKQAYLSAKSVANALGDEIIDFTEGGEQILNRIDAVGDSVTLYDISFEDSDYDAGEAEALITRVDDDTIKISVTAVVGEKSRTVSLQLYKGTSDALDGEFPGLTIPDDTTNVVWTYSVNGVSDENIYAKSGSTIVFMSSARFSGNLYAEDGATIQFSDSCEIYGSIYAQSGTNFQFTETNQNKISFEIESRIFVKDGAIINVNGNSHTVSLNNNKVKFVPGNINSDFSDAFAIFGGSDSTDWWVKDGYE